VLANPVRAVELLAAFAALRADNVDVPLPEPEPDPDLDVGEQTSNAGDDREGDDDGDGHGDSGDAGLRPGDRAGDDRIVEPDALDRMDAFARRVGFTPRRVPTWLTPPTPAPAPAPTSPSGSAPPTTDPPEPPGPTEPPGPFDPSDPRSRQPLPEFRFDWSRLLPSLTLYLHLSADDLAAGAGGVVRWEGEGPVTHAFVHQHLRPLHDYVIKPVLDLAHQAPVDAYELPDRLREAVRLLAPTDVFPYASTASAGLDVDHTVPYDPSRTGGPEKKWATRLGNLGPLTRSHHRIKTHGHWTLRQPFPGIYLWRDPHGLLYLEDHTGTHPVGAARRHDPDLDLYPTDQMIEADFGRQA
jgi:hypothetical protein